jgi:hypothetical protein
MSDQPGLFETPPHEILERMHIRNQKLLSSHFLAYRLPGSSVWAEAEGRARDALDRICRAFVNAEAMGVPESGSEAQTEQEFIRPALEALGWEFIVQPSLTGYDAKRRPDYALYVDAKSKRIAGQHRENMRAFYGNAAAIAEAKYWGRPMNDWVQADPHDKSDATKQIASYLTDVSDWTDGGRTWGILTNGSLWRLFQRRAGYTAENSLEIDLEAILRNRDSRAFQYFYMLFSRDAFAQSATRTVPWLQSFVEGSEEYSTGITDRLKTLVFDEVLDVLALGFVRYRRHALGVPIESETELSCRAIYQGCLALLYRLLFLLNAEARGLLPMDNREYRQRSLRKLLERIHDMRGATTDPDHDFDCWGHLQRLFELMDEGSTALNLPRYNGGLFSRPSGSLGLKELGDEELGPWFLETHRLSDPYLCSVLRSLAFDDERTTGSRAFIDYSSLGVRHLGEIYEGLLEFRVELSPDDVVCLTGPEARPSWKRKSELGAGEEVLDERKPGEPYITNDKGERRASGSYYTGHYIVEYIVDRTIGARLEEFRTQHERARQVDSAAGGELQALFRGAEGVAADSTREALWSACANDAEREHFLKSELDERWAEHRFDVATRALNLRILDPAMGSGHFLVHAVDVVSDAIARCLSEASDSPIADQLESLRTGILQNVAEQHITIDPSRLTDINLIKRMVMKRCVYGVDLNPMAVELAKVSLWLDSFTVGAPLSFLDHHLRCGNSLVGCSVGEVRSALEGEVRGGHVHLGLLTSEFTGLMLAVEAMREVGELTDATIADVQRSYERYANAVDALAPFKRLLDVWTSEHFGVTDARKALRERPESVERAIAFASGWSAILDKKAKASLDLACGALGAARGGRFFHWELEFPEVWYENGVRRIFAGFDIVIGNPPWGADTDAIARFAQERFRLAHGQYDSWDLFLESALAQLRTDGANGFVVPDSILQPEHAETRGFLCDNSRLLSAIRLGEGSFRGVSRAAFVYCMKKGSGPFSVDTLQLRKEDRVVLQEGRGTLKAVQMAHGHTVPGELFIAEDDHEFRVGVSVDDLRLMRKMETGRFPWGSLLEDMRGMELGKAGKVALCPNCSLWMPRPTGLEEGDALCAHCGKRVPPDAHETAIVCSKRGPGRRRLIVGESVGRYSLESELVVDTRYAGIDYKPDAFYEPPKLLVRKTGVGIFAALDYSSSMTNQVVFIFRKKMVPDVAVQEISLEYVMGLLSSRAMLAYYVLRFGEREWRSYPYVTQKVLKKLPLRDPASLKNGKQLHNRITELVREASSPGTGLPERLDLEIEDCVESIYAMSRRDRERVAATLDGMQRLRIVREMSEK